MKTPEDEAFEDIERRQGGGFPAKRAMAADKLHWSDCAVHNGPAYPAGPCDCGVAQEPVNLLEARRIAAEYGTLDSQVDNGNLYFALRKCLEHIDAQLAQQSTKELQCQELEIWANSVWEARATPSLPAQEPIAYVTGTYNGRFVVAPLNPAMVLPVGMAFYTTPPKREWVGLTDADIERIKLMTYEKETNADGEEQEAVNIDWLIKTAEHFCKEKNT